jgi:hypothetical protein
MSPRGGDVRRQDAVPLHRRDFAPEEPMGRVRRPVRAVAVREIERLGGRQELDAKTVTAFSTISEALRAACTPIET